MATQRLTLRGGSASSDREARGRRQSPVQAPRKRRWGGRGPDGANATSSWPLPRPRVGCQPTEGVGRRPTAPAANYRPPTWPRPLWNTTERLRGCALGPTGASGGSELRATTGCGRDSFWASTAQGIEFVQGRKVGMQTALKSCGHNNFRPRIRNLPLHGNGWDGKLRMWGWLGCSGLAVRSEAGFPSCGSESRRIRWMTRGA